MTWKLHNQNKTATLKTKMGDIWNYKIQDYTGKSSAG